MHYLTCITHSKEYGTFKTPNALCDQAVSPLTHAVALVAFISHEQQQVIKAIVMLLV